MSATTQSTDAGDRDRGDGPRCDTGDASGHDYQVLASELLLDAPIIAVRRDTIATPTGRADREIVEHFSAVAVAAVRDGEVLLIRQYRHGVHRRLWEVPAGLLDVAGEAPLDAARRELQEEAGLRAGTWHLLGDIVTSPGVGEETCRIFLAEDLVEGEIPAGEDEEADLERAWVPVPEAVAMVQDGRIVNSVAVAAVLHLHAGTRRSVDEPMEYRSGLAARRGSVPGRDMKHVR
ncbi:NUDIX hydrolase [Corynebacterium bovis]|uniref:NUDIX hydrolase n=1 Tax=Corynebacterium bovis TaxID=36808 RepID=UPI00244D1E20|nr:NUDIX hydrolase [Corynebacterium bovis]MDH2454881.1 NUDIX hydrolase [Corynebacterium bovis]